MNAFILDHPSDDKLARGKGGYLLESPRGSIVHFGHSGLPTTTSLPPKKNRQQNKSLVECRREEERSNGVFKIEFPYLV